MRAISARVICAMLAAATALAIGANAFARNASDNAAEPKARAPDGGLLRVQDKGPQPDNGPQQGEAKKPAKQLNTLQEVFAALEACWIPPSLDHARPGMQITVLLSFKRNGELNGKPRITYETPSASDDERLAYRVAMAEALRRCTPLPFSEALGNAFAGRPMTMRFIDNRNLKQAGI
jgi:hypothetical protein